MAHDTARSLQEELPAHGQWVQKLARSLVRDEASAEDLAQDARLAALRHGQSIGALGPFLARVLRNFARRSWRDAARRTARERAVARPEALPGVDESAARLEIQRRLVDELAALEPAVRHVLVRRYFDGWTAARIARETGEPAATVRWRLQRGLAELRVRLDRVSGGDGVQWQLALLPVCAQATPWAALGKALRPLAGAGTIQGALTMKAATQVLAASVLVAAVGFSVWWSVERAEAPRAAEVNPPAPDEIEQQDGTEIAAQPAPAAPLAREVLALAPGPARQEERAAAETPAVTRVDGRCVDEQLVPIGRARVSQVDQEPARSAESASDGSFAFAVAPDRFDACTLEVGASGCATRFVAVRLPGAGLTHVGDIVLRPGGSVRGRVLGPDGAPFAGATVAVTPPDLWGSIEEARVQGPTSAPLIGGVSGGDGRFEIEGIGVGPMRAWAWAEGMRHSVSAPIDVRAHASTDEIELLLERIQGDDRITGIALSPEGEPVPEAVVWGNERSAGSQTSFAISADAGGKFEIEAKPNHVYDLEVSDPEKRWSPVEIQGVAPGTRELEFAFAPARWLEVRVVTPSGRALEDYEVAADGEEAHTQRMFRRAAAGPHPGGSARVLAPSEPFFVRVDARGYAPAERGPILPAETPTSLVIELVPEPGVRGQVLADGKPLGGAAVTLQGADPRWQIEHQGYPCLYSPSPDDETTTDAEGRFTLRARTRGAFVVRAEVAGLAAADSGPLELDPRVGRGDLVLALDQGGALEGRVLVAAGRDPAGVIVAMNRGDAFPCTVRADDAGHFRFERLMPGPWHLSRGKAEFNPKGGGTSFSTAKTPTVIPFNCTIRAGETVYQDLDLRDSEPCELGGVLFVNGAPAKDWGVMAWPGAKEAVVGTPPSTATAADGSFALTLDEPGPLRLSFSPPAELGAQGRVDVLTELRSGANEWHADFSMGRLSGRCLAQTPSEEQSLFYNTAAGVVPSCWLPILPDENGRYALPFVPVGRGAIKRLAETDGSWSWTTLVETEIPAHGERSLDVP